MNSKARRIVLLLAIAAIPLAGILITNASGKTRRAALGRPIIGAPPMERTPVYTAGTFSFTAPLVLAKPLPVDLPVQFIAQSGEPEIKIDLFGNIYVAAINGVPGGTDLWKSVDNGATFQFIGQPDGAQDHCPDLPTCFGLGGADDSIDVSTGGYLYISSLWVGDVTVSTSFDGGMGWRAPGAGLAGDPPRRDRECCG